MGLKKSRELTNSTVKLLSNFQTGKFKPIPTGIDHLDRELMGGLLPGSIVGIVARSSHGKSYDLERIQRHILANEGDNVIFINANWELSHFKILVRDLVQTTGIDMRELLFTVPEGENLKKIAAVCDLHRTDNVLYQNEPVSAETFRKDIEEVIAEHQDKVIIVGIDNLENILVTKGDQKSSMDELLSIVNRLKNMHPFISFIILDQMNNNYTMRMDDLKKQKPIESDIYGTDQLLKLCDVLYIKMIPYRLGIRDKFMVFNKASYSWLEEFKIDGQKNLAHFDPVGVAFYFYLKRRNADPKDFRDVYAERLFHRSEIPDMVEEEEKKEEAPTFNTTKPVFDSVNFNTSALQSGQGEGFEETPF